VIKILQTVLDGLTINPPVANLTCAQYYKILLAVLPYNHDYYLGHPVDSVEERDTTVSSVYCESLDDEGI